MPEKQLRNKILFLVPLFCLLSAPFCNAQFFWLDGNNDSYITIEGHKPFFAEEANATFGTSTWFLTGSIRVSPGLTFRADLPVSTFGIDSPISGSSNETAVGNPYVGVEIGRQRRNIVLDAGVRLPVLGPNDQGNLAGVFTEWVDRLEAFSPETMPVTAGINFRNAGRSRLYLNFRCGVAGWIPTNGEDDLEAFVQYGAKAGIRSNRVHVSGGVAGRTIITEDQFDLADDSQLQAALSGSVRIGNTEPGIMVRVPLDENLSDTIKSTIGVFLKVHVN